VDNSSATREPYCPSTITVHMSAHMLNDNRHRYMYNLVSENPTLREACLTILRPGVNAVRIQPSTGTMRLPSSNTVVIEAVRLHPSS
jgi:hypothetical protein